MADSYYPRPDSFRPTPALPAAPLVKRAPADALRVRISVRIPAFLQQLPWRRILIATSISCAIAAGAGLLVVHHYVRNAEALVSQRQTLDDGGALFPLLLEAGSQPGSTGNQANARPLFSGGLEGSRVRSMNLSFGEVPESLRRAVLAIEDHRFYEHSGIDWIRTTKAAWDGLVSAERPKGTSTITQQLARNVYLDRTEAWRRKWNEAAIAVVLERRLSKDEILERYLNFVPMGHFASFDIAGVGLASRVYFGKDAKDLTLPEAAMLAGMIQAPSRLQPKLHPAQAKRRRHLVLSAMKRAGSITPAEFAEADAAELSIAVPAAVESGDFFVDAVGRELRSSGVETGGGTRVRTTVDMRLQSIAETAAEVWGARLEKRFKRKGVAPQIAIVALDPSSGALRAVVGGRSFAQSQLNRAYAKRAPGSLFKAFVYAAALNASVLSGKARFSPETMIDDSPVEIAWTDGLYAPSNYHDTYHGEISLQQALNLSANSAAVRLAGEVGYKPIARLARNAGLKGTEASPSAALGAYDATPVEVAAAYAVFANGGFAVEPRTIESVVSANGNALYSPTGGKTQLLDPRAAYLMSKMLQGVVVSGTASRARSMGVLQPAGGKTGTTRDSWFAGFTSGLVCVVWVGFDDHRNLGMDGADGALPIWADVMKQAAKLKPYSDAQDFRKPYGVDEFLAAARDYQPETGGNNGLPQ